MSRGNKLMPRFTAAPRERCLTAGQWAILPPLCSVPTCKCGKSFARGGRHDGERQWTRWLAAALVVVACGSAQASDYDPTHSALVAGTMNFHWSSVFGIEPCAGIEFTDGDLVDAADGEFSMMGVSVSNNECTGTGSYEFVLSADRTTLDGIDTFANVPMTLVRGRGEKCFVGRWIREDYIHVGTLSAAAGGRCQGSPRPARAAGWRPGKWCNNPALTP
jgi:hypothetical protein